MKVLALAWLVLAVALAGCAAPPPQEPVERAERTEEPAPGLVGSGEAANATPPEEPGEFARSLDEKFHTHNYWGAGLEKVLMDQDITASSVVRDSQFGPVGSVFESAFFLLFAGPGLTIFELPEGSIVPPEANRLEVTVTWAESPLITGLRLGYRTAQDWDLNATEPFPKGGGTIVIPTNLTQNDIPHTTVSKWLFGLVPDAEQGPEVFNGTVHVTMKAFRDDVLYVAPPHNDFWGSQTHLDLFEDTRALKATRAGFPFCPATEEEGFEACGFVDVEPPNGTLVPPHTGLLTVTLQWQNNATTPDPFGLGLDLYYAHAGAFDLTPAEGQVVQPGKAVYTIPLEARMWDSPYAEESEWDFIVFPRSRSSPLDGPFGTGAVGQFDGYFTLSVQAEREAL